tara:strand:+ start:198 stop:386 length:189 start_codon:yes stop_codon:yes gene_type:complete
MMNLNLHGVTGVEVEEMNVLKGGTVHRVVKIFLEDGNKFEVDLFGETHDKLKIRSYTLNTIE